MKVVYGHTDSIYVQISSIDKAKKAIKEIEASVREHFPNVMGLKEHPVQLEFEKYYSALGVGITKNRNAGLITWDDGVYLDEPKFIMTGFTAKRVSETVLAKEVQTTVLKMWVENKPLSKINEYLNDVYSSVLTGTVSVSSVIKRSRLRNNRFMVKCPECKKKYHLTECVKLNQSVCKKCSTPTSSFLTLEGKRPSLSSGVTGVIYGWEKDMEFNDSYLHIKCISNDYYTHPLTHQKRRLEYFSGRTLKDFKDIKPDWPHYAQQVIDKAKPIYNAMGWDLSSIKTGKIQMSLEEWF